MKEFNYREVLSNGYCVDTSVPDWLTDISNGSFESKTERQLLNSLHSIVNNIYSNIANNLSGKITIPLSGGYDSRFILANMLSRIPKDSIKCVTYGAENNLDRRIAEDLCTKWDLQVESIDLDSEEINISKLVDLTHRNCAVPIIEKFYNNMLFDRAPESHATLVSGFMGEALTGGHYLSESNHTTEEGIQRFFISQKNTNSTKPYLPIIELPHSSLDFLKRSNMRHSEFLDISFRQRCYISNVVLPNGWYGWNIDQSQGSRLKVICPFLDPEWTEFWISVNRRHHVGQELFKKLFFEIDSALAIYPSKYSKGYSSSSKLRPFINKVNRTIRNKLSDRFPQIDIRDSSNDNYIDFERAYRVREDYIVLFKDSLDYANWPAMIEREFLEVFSQHTEKKRNHGMLLNNIISASLYKGKFQ